MNNLGQTTGEALRGATEAAARIRAAFGRVSCLVCRSVVDQMVDVRDGAGEIQTRTFEPCGHRVEFGQRIPAPESEFEIRTDLPVAGL